MKDSDDCDWDQSVLCIRHLVLEFINVPWKLVRWNCKFWWIIIQFLWTSLSWFSFKAARLTLIILKDFVKFLFSLFSLFVFLLLHQEAGWWIISENLWRSFQTVPQDQVWRNDSRQHLHAGMQKIRYYLVTNFSLRGGSRGDVHGMHTPPSDHLWISYITSIVEKKEKKTVWFIDVEVKHETRLKNLS